MIKFVAIYFIIISAVTVAATIYDKTASKVLTQKRVPEKTLLILAFLGGAIAEYMTMTIIRHKTKKNIFMNGLPLIFLLHSIIFFISVLIYYL